MRERMGSGNGHQNGPCDETCGGCAEDDATASESRWDPRAAAERLAEGYATVLDFVGRVDRAVMTGDMWYLVDKGRELKRAVERLLELADELREEQTPIRRHLPLVEDYLIRVGRMGYPAIAALHRGPALRGGP